MSISLFSFSFFPSSVFRKSRRHPANEKKRRSTTLSSWETTDNIFKEVLLFCRNLLQLNSLHSKTCWGIFQWKQPRLCAAVILSNNLFMRIFLFTYLNSLELQGLRTLINISGNVTCEFSTVVTGATAIIAHLKHYKTRKMMHKT